jgi:hypothetical protein
MTSGRDLPEIERRGLHELASGEAARSTTPADPRCRLICGGTERATLDAPSKFGTERGTGRRVVYCPCCGHELWNFEHLSPEQRRLVIDNIRPANLNPALVAGSWRRFVDLICWYDVIVLKDVKEAR